MSRTGAQGVKLAPVMFRPAARHIPSAKLGTPLDGEMANRKLELCCGRLTMKEHSYAPRLHDCVDPSES